MYILREYQREALEKLRWSAMVPGNSLCVLPTGAGKSLVIAEFAHSLGRPILILVSSREILEQDVEKMENYVDKSEIGVFSASVGRKDISTFTFATIQSIYKKPDLCRNFGNIIIDEAHLVPVKSLGSMFMQFLKDIGDPKVTGFTATPYRMDTSYVADGFGGWIAYTTTKLINRMGKEKFWDRIIYNIDNDTLTKQGYLCPIRYLDKSVIQHKDIPLNISMSDFDLKAYEKKIKDKEEDLIAAVFLGEAIGKSTLVFCSSIDQATTLSGYVEGSKVVTSKTSPKERSKTIEDFKNGSIKTVFNVGVLTTGFDHPSLDCIVLLRPTRSIGLYYQMIGRGVRMAEGKKRCTVIDMTGTVKEIGPISSIKLVKRNMWELESATRENWHNVVLYERNIQR